MYLEMNLLNLFLKSHLGIHEIQAWWLGIAALHIQGDCVHWLSQNFS